MTERFRAKIWWILFDHLPPYSAAIQLYILTDIVIDEARTRDTRTNESSLSLRESVRDRLRERQDEVGRGRLPMGQGRSRSPTQYVPYSTPLTLTAPLQRFSHDHIA